MSEIRWSAVFAAFLGLAAIVVAVIAPTEALMVQSLLGAGIIAALLALRD